ncbi:hypothetical protein CR513_35748, partial [Mucuna pruriens]
MEEESKPIRQQQRRVNPTILDVVKKEVTKLLVIGIIYPISDSQWVSPVQVVPKKYGMTDNRCTPVDGNLNIWPSLVHHCHPSKAIVVEGGLSRER